MFSKFKYFLFFSTLFLIASCSDDSMYLDEQEALQNDGTETIETRGNSDYESNLCVTNCNLNAKECYDWAEHLRDGHLLSCELALIIGTEEVDVYCTRQVVAWVEQVPVYSPEGELIRYDEVIHYTEEEYVCGQETVNILSTDPIDLQEYEACKAAAQAEFVEELNKCDMKKVNCLKKCKKGGGEQE